MKSLKAFTTMSLIGMAVIGIEAAAQVPTVWVIGDSTASNADRRGWGDPFGDYFDQGKVHTANRAQQPHLYHRGSVGEGARGIEARRFCADPVWAQRWRPTGQGPGARLAARVGRRVQGIHAAQRKPGNGIHLRALHAANDR